jgi:hypothetical protein
MVAGYGELPASAGVAGGIRGVDQQAANPPSNRTANLLIGRHDRRKAGQLRFFKSHAAFRTVVARAKPDSGPGD